MKRKPLFIVVLMALSICVHAKKYKVAVSLPQAQKTQFERTAQWALQTIAANEPSKAEVTKPAKGIYIRNGQKVIVK